MTPINPSHRNSFMFSLASFIQEQETLPTCRFTWVGPRSKTDTTTGHTISGHDTEGVKKFASYAKNPVEFYCLEKYGDENIAEQYEKEFQEEGFSNIKVKTLEGFIRDCYESKDEFLRDNAELFSTIFNTHIQKKTRKDFVAIKELFSLLLAYQGGYALDSNVRPLHQKSFSLPHYDDFMAPALEKENLMEVWMLYAPKNNKRIKKSILQLLNDWKTYKIIFIVQAVEKVMPLRDLKEDYPWKFEKVIGEVFMENLNLVKSYYNTHYPDKQWTKSAITRIKGHEWEKLNKMELHDSHYEKMLHIAIDEKRLDVIHFLMEKNLKFHSILTLLSQEILQKNTDTISAFNAFSLTETQNHFITKDMDELFPLLKKIFLWSIEYHKEDYIDFLEDNLQAPATDMIHTLCEHNKMLLLYQLVEDKAWEKLNIFLTPSLYKDLIVHPLNNKIKDEVGFSSHHEKSGDWISLLLTHPFHKLLGPGVLIMLKDALKKTRVEVVDPLFILYLQQVRDEYPKNEHAEDEHVENEHAKDEHAKDEHAENEHVDDEFTKIKFSDIVKELVWWAFSCEVLPYLNFLIKELKPQEIDKELLKPQYLHNYQFFHRKQEFVFQPWEISSPKQSPSPTPKKNRRLKENTPFENKPLEDKPFNKVVPILKLSGSSLFQRRKANAAFAKEVFTSPGAIAYNAVKSHPYR